MDVGVSVGPFLEQIPERPGPYEFVEVSLGEGEIPVDDLDREALTAALSAAGLDLVVHLPFRQPLATTVGRIDRANREYLAGLLRTCGELGAERAVVHVTTRQRRRDPDEVARERLPPAMRAVAAAGAEHGVEVCFENVGNVGGTRLELVGELAEAADVPLCLDVGHAFEERDHGAIERFVERHGDRIAHLHCHDVRRRGDTHLPIGSGDVDYGRVGEALSAAGFDGTATVEVFTDDAEYLALSAERLRAAL